MENEDRQLLNLAEQIGFEHTGTLDPAKLVLRPEVRSMCASGKCTRYGHSWSCPPACGSLERIRRRIREYRSGILVQTTGILEDPFDMDTIRKASETHKNRFQTLSRQARLLQPGCYPMSAGSCTICEECTYPDRPCRYPDRVFPSMEACGLVVSDVCRDAGIPYKYGENTITYTSCILTGRRKGPADPGEGPL